jgi:hypothetical protein
VTARPTAVLACCALFFAAPALASHTAHLDALSLGLPGCQAKAVWATPFNASGATLAAGTYLYTVAAFDAGGALGAGACAARSIQVVAVTHNAALLQFPATPGATGYRIYRQLVGTTPALEAVLVGGVSLINPSSMGCASGARCNFLDNGRVVNPAETIAPLGAATTGGTPADLRALQRVDYGGADTNTAAEVAGDDPFPAALKTDRFVLPAGLTIDASATRSANVPVKCPLTGAGSLLGDAMQRGSSDPNEDTCARATLVGAAQAVMRTVLGVQSIPGEVFNVSVVGTVAHRLYVVLRPSCSTGSALAPGSASCNAMLGVGNEFDKIFLALVSTVVDRGHGTTGLDGVLVQAADSSTLPSDLQVRQTSTGAAAGGPIALQLRSLTLELSGQADQGTAAAADDLAFVTASSDCAQALATDKTTYEDATISTATRTVALGGDCRLFRDGFE